MNQPTEYKRAIIKMYLKDSIIAMFEDYVTASSKFADHARLIYGRKYPTSHEESSVGNGREGQGIRVIVSARGSISTLGYGIVVSWQEQAGSDNVFLWWKREQEVGA